MCRLIRWVRAAVAILLMLFMAITSTGSAEQIAVSSLISYDIYRTYINVRTFRTPFLSRLIPAFPHL